MDLIMQFEGRSLPEPREIYLVPLGRCTVKQEQQLQFDITPVLAGIFVLINDFVPQHNLASRSRDDHYVRKFHVIPLCSQEHKAKNQSTYIQPAPFNQKTPDVLSVQAPESLHRMLSSNKEVIELPVIIPLNSGDGSLLLINLLLFTMKDETLKLVLKMLIRTDKPIKYLYHRLKYAQCIKT